MTEITTHHGLLTDVNLHVDDTGGPGRPVVLIHGWPLSGESWSEQIPVLEAAGYRVVSYDRRGFGRSDKPRQGYDYDTFADDLQKILETLGVQNATLVGFSMGGGEVARYLSRHGAERIHSVVFASAVPPYLAKSDDNPDGPLDEATATAMKEGLETDPHTFYESFTRDFYTAGGELTVSEAQREDAVRLADQADTHAALGAMAAFGTTDFRGDLPSVTVPALIVHGDSDGVVPFEGSGARTHAAIPGSRLAVIQNGPHGINVSHAGEFNEILLGFLAE